MSPSAQPRLVGPGTRLRGVARLIDPEFANVGEGLRVRRTLPTQHVQSVGPWVFLDHYGPARMAAGHGGVPAHPHAGIETVSYLFEGGMAHRDSAGHAGSVDAGGAQWMTAGAGIVHEEKPRGPEGAPEFTLHGVQMWTTLPRSLKFAAPAYQNLPAAELPVVERNGASVRVIGGAFDGVASPAATRMPLFLWHVTLEPGAAFAAPVPAGFEAAVYVVAGAARIAGAVAALGQLAVLEGDGGVALANASASAALDVLVFGGAPAEGPLLFHGPFVMNSAEQLRRVERAYLSGGMGTLAPA